MRYAEMLLIYAEAKIMNGDIDASVLTAINRVRARAYGVDVAETNNYPAITTTDATELKNIIRRERKWNWRMKVFVYLISVVGELQKK